MNDRNEPITAETPFRILVMGDFSGRGNRNVDVNPGELARRRILKIDRDNFEGVMDRLDVCLSNTIVDNENKTISVCFGELDDFEPDQLFESVSLFGQLRTLRQQLMNDSTFANAADVVRSWVDSESGTEVPAAESPENTEGEVSLDDLLSNTQKYQDEQVPSNTNVTHWDAMISNIVDPLISAGPDPDQEELVECVDAAIGESMRKLLHHPDFQALESMWRGLSMLIRRLDTDGDLQIHILDISSDEMALDLQQEDVTTSGLYRLIVENSVGTSGGQPWSAIIGSDLFSTHDDVAVLQQLAKIAKAAGAPFIGGTTGHAVGCVDPAASADADDWQTPNTSGNAQWQELLNSPEASSVELLWPRFRIRLPYGREATQIDAFEFEEMPSTKTADHADYLWCSPAFAAALMLGQSFMENGWQMRPGEIDEVDNLPLCYHIDDGEEVALPCGELLISDRVADRIRQNGITPLLSVKSQDTIQVGRFCGLNGEPLSGPWN